MAIHHKHSAVAAAAIGLAFALPAHAVSFSAFSFSSQVSTSGAFAGTNGIYGSGDVRLDAVSYGGTTYGASRLETVSSTRIVLDDALDPTYGGGNLASGRGIDSVADSWAPQGPATVTPTSADLQASLANTNLSSLVVTRENPGTAIIDVTFAQATTDFLFYERGFNSDLLVQALNANDQVIGSYTILRANYQQTGIIVSTDNGAFTLAGQELGSIGVHSDVAIDHLRLSSYKSDTIDFNGPDFKVLAVSPVPEPASTALLAGGLAGMLIWLGRRRAG